MNTLYQEATGNDLPKWVINQERQGLKAGEEEREASNGGEGDHRAAGPWAGSSQSRIEQESERPGGMLPRKENVPIW